MTHPGISEGRRQGHYVVEEEEELRGFGLERLMVSLWWVGQTRGRGWPVSCKEEGAGLPCLPQLASWTGLKERKFNNYHQESEWTQQWYRWNRRCRTWNMSCGITDRGRRPFAGWRGWRRGRGGVPCGCVASRWGGGSLGADGVLTLLHLGAGLPTTNNTAIASDTGREMGWGQRRRRATSWSWEAAGGKRRLGGLWREGLNTSMQTDGRGRGTATVRDRGRRRWGRRGVPHAWGGGEQGGGSRGAIWGKKKKLDKINKKQVQHWNSKRPPVVGLKVEDPPPSHSPLIGGALSDWLGAPSTPTPTPAVAPPLLGSENHNHWTGKQSSSSWWDDVTNTLWWHHRGREGGGAGWRWGQWGCWMKMKWV